MAKTDRNLHKNRLKARQVAALPLRVREGRLEVLMVTSRDTGRWVLPKGWPMKGRSLSAAARIEALEEAGAEGDILRQRIGRFRYIKRVESGPDYECKTDVFPLAVRKLLKTWPEADERTRQWFALSDAAKHVWEAELAQLLHKLDGKPKSLPGMKGFLKSL